MPAQTHAERPTLTLQKQEQYIEFTDQEKVWLKNHPKIRLAFDGYFPPFSFLNESDDFEGLAVDVFNIISERLEISFTYYTDATWKTLYAAAEKREVDAVATMVKLPRREQTFEFTSPYIFKSLVIMTQEGDTQIKHRDDLVDKTVALVKGYQYVDSILEKYPTIQPYYVDTMLDGLNAVAIGNADAAVTFFGGGHYLRTKHNISNIKFAAMYDQNSSQESIAVRKDWPELAGLFEKALKSISESEMLALQAKWLPTHELQSIARIALTEKEREWIKKHPVIRLGVDPEFAPFEYMDDGAYSGISSDIIQILNQRLGLNMQVVSGLSWKEAVEKAEKKAIDVLPCVGLTEDRKKFLNYTKPYVNFHRVIITRSDQHFITGLRDVRHKSVAVQSNSSHEGYLKDHSDIKAIGYETLQESLLALSNGEVDAFVGNVASATYWIRKMHLTNLKVAAPVSQELQNLHFAVRNDWPELTSILQKGLDSVSDTERREISEKWILIEYDPVVDVVLIWKISLGFIALLCIVGLWNIQIRKQKEAVQKAEKETQAANKELTKLHGKLEDLVEIRTAELKASEKNFRQAQKMEALGTLVGGIAHDFNNMLAGITGNTYLAKMNSHQSSEVEQHLDVIEELSFSAADMIKQLLSFARHEQASKSMLPLTQFIKETNKLIEIGVEELIQFNQDICHENLIVNANSTQLQQVLFNLVNNARDATLNVKNPEIFVRLYKFEADNLFYQRHPEMKQPNFAVIEVQDNGDGISDDNIAKVFDPFFTTKEVDKGTGLGLAMVYGCTKDHGGVLEVESSLGQGSSFKLYLPLEEEAERRQESSEIESIPRGSGEWILLVDDDVKLLNTNKQILTKLGYQVAEAKDGKEAVELYASHKKKIDLVIMDVMMPNMTGADAVQQIRRIKGNVKVIYMTGYDSKGALTRQLKQSAVPVLNKPCSINYLARIIHEQINSGQEYFQGK